MKVARDPSRSNTDRVLDALSRIGGTLPELADRTGLPTLVVMTTITHINVAHAAGVPALPRIYRWPQLDESGQPIAQTIYTLTPFVAFPEDNGGAE